METHEGVAAHVWGTGRRRRAIHVISKSDKVSVLIVRLKPTVRYQWFTQRFLMTYNKLTR